MIQRLPLFVAAAAALLLAGCSFGPKVPATLMRLTAVSEPAAAAGRTGAASQALTVVPPTVTQELATQRVPVRTGATQVAYLKDAQWVETPAVMFARLVSDTVAARTGRVVLDPKQFTFDPGQRLTGTLRSFGVESDTMQAVVVYDAALARGTDQVETRRFEARVPVTAMDSATVADALNRAANQVAAEVATWVG
jgi:cholesterol transport system auxiliary component